MLYLFGGRRGESLASGLHSWLQLEGLSCVCVYLYVCVCVCGAGAFIALKCVFIQRLYAVLRQGGHGNPVWCAREMIDHTPPSPACAAGAASVLPHDVDR